MRGSKSPYPVIFNNFARWATPSFLFALRWQRALVRFLSGVFNYTDVSR